ncbi:hypothetical protein PBAL39_23948 [Pedobacter sp. BAL39]|nr:hypothetical protein PBAL39_23948 [Pedobacter sp. BAL39]
MYKKQLVFFVLKSLKERCMSSKHKLFFFANLSAPTYPKGRIIEDLTTG